MVTSNAPFLWTEFPAVRSFGSLRHHESVVEDLLMASECGLCWGNDVPWSEGKLAIRFPPEMTNFLEESANPYESWMFA